MYQPSKPPVRSPHQFHCAEAWDFMHAHSTQNSIPFSQRRYHSDDIRLRNKFIWQNQLNKILLKTKQINKKHPAGWHQNISPGRAITWGHRKKSIRQTVLTHRPNIKWTLHNEFEQHNRPLTFRWCDCRKQHKPFWHEKGRPGNGRTAAAWEKMSGG